MSAWSGVIRGDRGACIETCHGMDVPDAVKVAVEELLNSYPGENPVAQRVMRRPKDPSRPVETAQASDGSTHAVGNFEDIKITHEGVYRVTVHGNPEAYGTVLIQVDADFSSATATESPA